MKEITLDTAMMIIEKFDAVALTDHTGRYIYANQNWFDTAKVDKNSFNKLYTWEVFNESKVKKVINSKEPLLGHILNLENKMGVVNYYPIFKDGEFYGVLILTIFSAMEAAVNLSEKIEKLSKELKKAKEEIKNLSKASYSINCIIGNSESTNRLRQEIIETARTNSTVLIEGETGVGKELVAHSIHDLSSRSNNRFVRVNCSAIPSELMESEFFGYDEGAFTGARRGGKDGKFELANGGSIFLDEINSLPLTMQPKFLRVLQEREVERIGGKDSIFIDVRVIATTNESLENLVASNKFREDLFYRLNVIKIKVPPLREHLEDIPKLTNYIVNKLNHLLNLEITLVDDAVYEMLKGYAWPGNIRELQNVIERAMNHCYGSTLKVEHFYDFLRLPRTDRCVNSIAAQKKSLEYELITNKLDMLKGNKSAVAKELGISRTALYKKLKKYGL